MKSKHYPTNKEWNDNLDKLVPDLMEEQVDTMAEIQLRFAVSHFLEYYPEKKMFDIVLEEVEKAREA